MITLETQDKPFVICIMATRRWVAPAERVNHKLQYSSKSIVCTI